MTETDRRVRNDKAGRLMAAMAAGDHAALGRLMELFAPGLTRFARHCLTQPQEAEDVVQEAFLRAWRAAGGYDPERGAVSTWLYRIALRLCIDRNRRTGLRRFLGLEAAPELKDGTAGTEQVLIARQELGRVQAAVRTLPARQRQALLLRAIGGLSTEEIAAAMQAAPGAVEQLLVRARAGLRSRLGE